MLVRLTASLVLAASLFAPVQCASKPKPELRTEDDPAEALYQLADRFKAEGNAAARVKTLQFVVERYPSSRFAERAKGDLQEAGVASKP